jgi:hypothetical protein
VSDPISTAWFSLLIWHFRLTVPEKLLCEAIINVVVTVCPVAGISKLAEVDDMTTVPGELLLLLGSDPAPVRTTDCEEPLPFATMVSTPTCAPEVVGAKVTDTRQLAPIAKLPSHVLVSEKSSDTATSKFKALPLMLVKVTVWAVLIVPSCCEAKLRAPGLRETKLLVPGADTLGQSTCVTPYGPELL